MGKNQFFRAAFFGMDVKVLAYIQKDKKYVQATNDSMETALHCACSSASSSTVKLLLENGADPNARNQHGETPLHYASVNGLLRSVQILVQYGADPNNRSVAGYRPADLTSDSQVREYFASIEQGERQRYEPLLQAIATEDCKFAVAVANAMNLTEGVQRKEKDAIAKKFVKIFDAQGLAMKFIEVLTAAEVNATIHDNTLFRTDSLTTKVTSNYAKLVGLDYLEKTIGPIIRKTLENPTGYELDDGKVSGPQLEKNLQRVTELCKTFMDAIFRSVDICPPPIRHICWVLRTTVEAKFPESKHIAVGGFIFLRFFNAAVSNPNQFGLVQGPQPEMEQRRGLVLIAKIVQNLSNGVEFGAKEAYMKPMNQFIMDYQAPIKQFLDRMSAVSLEAAGARIPPQFTADNITAADLIFLHTVLVRLLPKIGEYFGASPEQIEEAKPLVAQEKKFTRKSVGACTVAKCECVGWEPMVMLTGSCFNCVHQFDLHDIEMPAPPPSFSLIPDPYSRVLSVCKYLGPPVPEQWQNYFS
eukprot:TRINITY_DN609_c2_g2_i1.p1 TRINITY_DN609_c2_g2~~TRINITY_DN609_c2_g2_i1.p1  ORF type:complete len:535 (+),score=134.29 TRINITY_DN609_c2_g2_i1:24-1607(+)